MVSEATTREELMSAAPPAPPYRPALWEQLLERDLFPDWLLRLGIRRLVRMRAAQEAEENNADAGRQHAFRVELRRSPVAIETAAANRQHYEVPPRFFELALGKHRKYSCCYYPPGIHTLEAAEEAMLALTVARAGIESGQDILELGCGWGSLSLWMARQFPWCRIVAVSNSRAQREFIEAEVSRRALNNLKVVTADMNVFQPGRTFDRVVSVEMFEHMRNYQELMRRIATWLNPGGRLFVHIFCHEKYAYPFTIRDSTDWMAQYFFTGGIMPSEELLLHFQDDLKLVERWRVEGGHYQETCEAWLRNLDRNRWEVLDLFERTYGRGEGVKWLVRWRVFMLACAELFGYRGGHEWFVGHYLFEKP